MRLTVAVLLLIPLSLAAQSEGSLEKQRASIRRQAGAESSGGASFFVVPWPATGTSFIAPDTSVASIGAIKSAPASIAPWEPVASQPPAACERIPEAQLDTYLEEIAAREGFTPDLLRAVISKESAYYPCAISSKGAQGLMQLTPATAAGLGVSDPFDPKENIDGGARYLAELLTRYHGDLPLALGAYNAGPSVVDTYQGIPPYPETIDYVSDILDRLN